MSLGVYREITVMLGLSKVFSKIIWRIQPHSESSGRIKRSSGGLSSLKYCQGNAGRHKHVQQCLDSSTTTAHPCCLSCFVATSSQKAPHSLRIFSHVSSFCLSTFNIDSCIKNEPCCMENSVRNDFLHFLEYKASTILHPMGEK